MRSPTWKLSEFHHLKFHFPMWDLLCCWPLTSGNWIQSLDLLSSEVAGVKESSNPLIIAWPSWWPAPISSYLEGLPVISFLIIIWKIFIIWKTAKSFRGCMLGTRDKDKYLLHHFSLATSWRGPWADFYRWHQARGKSRPHGESGSPDGCR